MVTSETIEKAKLIIKEYARHGSLKKACEIYDLSLVSLFQARLDVPLIEHAYSIARKVKADALADEIPEIADTEPNPHRARIRCDARRWVCAAFNRPVYGEKVDMTIEARVDLTSALLEARERAQRRIGDPEDAQKTQVVDITSDSPAGSTDSQSDSPSIDEENVDPFD